MRTKPTTITCTQCRREAPRPADMQWRPLWDEGWRWIGTQDLYSCPGCPPVILIDGQGRHLRGPGAASAPPTDASPV